MATMADDSFSSQYMGDLKHTSTSPGPLQISDLDPQQASTSLSRPHKLAPLQHDMMGGKAARTKRKKTRKHNHEQEQRGNLDGSEGGQVEENSNPLLDASTLQQMQARLDPLYSAIPSPNADQTGVSSGSESIPIRDAVDDEGEVQRKRRRRSRRAATGADRGRGEGEGQAEKPRHRRRRRSRRESGSGVSETALQEEVSEQRERVAEEERVAGHDDGSSLTHPGALQRQTVPQYYPPPEEIRDDREEGEGVVSSLPSTLTHHHTTQSPNIVFVERADGRGFNVRRKSSSVVPTDDTTCTGNKENYISSDLLALYSHRFVQSVALIAHGLVAGLSLWDCVVVNVISSLPGRHLNLLQTYHSLSLPAHSLYLLLLSLATISLLDRLDLAKLGKECWQFTLRSLPGLAVLTATVLTGVALVLSLSLAAIDDRVSLYPDQPSLWPDIVSPLNLTSTNSTLPLVTTHTTSQDVVYIPADDEPTTSRLKVWLGLSVFRSICCVLGWGLLVLVSGHDRMEEYISSMVDSSLSKQQSQGPSGAPNTATGSHNPTNEAQTPTTMHITPRTTNEVQNLSPPT